MLNANGKSLVIYKEVKWYNIICRNNNKTNTNQEYKNICFNL